MELEGFGIDPTEKRAMWREATEQVCNLLAMDPYPGYQGKYFSMPCRNLVPKPVQKPHPPLWLACSNRETIHLAAQLGVGALTFAFVDPAEARHWVTDYYETFKRECVPIGHTVNPNVAMVTGFSVHEDEQTALDRGLDGFRFFGFALGPPLRLRQPQARAHRHLAELPADGLADARHGAPGHRHAGPGARAPAELRGRRRRPGDLHPAGRPQPPRPHLRSPSSSSRGA